jgi:DNA-binding response OmpR family regulator
MQIGVETSRAVDNKRIFVVDTDEITRAALQFMLHDENETHELASLEEAYAKGAEWKPDIVLLGLGIVRATGLGVLGEIGQRLAGAKILLIADAAADPLLEAGLAAGALGTIVKPLTIEGVRRRVDLVLGRLQEPLVQLEILG